MDVTIVTTATRPDLAEVTGRWRWAEFWSRYGRSLDEVLGAERAAALTSSALPRTLVRLADGEPVGMASLAATDPEEKPDLGPWLAGVYVLPSARKLGHATALVGAVEELAHSSSIATLWLYTRTAETLYRRCGWRAVEPFERNGRIYALMRRDLAGHAAAEALR